MRGTVASQEAIKQKSDELEVQDDQKGAIIHLLELKQKLKTNVCLTAQSSDILINY